MDSIDNFMLILTIWTVLAVFVLAVILEFEKPKTVGDLILWGFSLPGLIFYITFYILVRSLEYVWTIPLSRKKDG